MLDAGLTWLRTAPLPTAALGLFLENLLIFALALGGGAVAVRLFSARRVALPAPKTTRREWLVAWTVVVLNTAVTVLGLVLWRRGVITFRTDTGFRALLDTVVLLVVMDLAMYVLHRVAHHPLLFSWMHRLHHEFDRPRPLTLFILNPIENVSFGLLWLTVITAYESSWLGMSAYLVLNVLFGTIGHLGVEPMPDASARLPVLRWIAGSTFHARHHQDPTGAFGFYTLVWDRLFGTLPRGYAERFGRLPCNEEGLGGSTNGEPGVLAVARSDR